MDPTNAGIPRLCALLCKLRTRARRVWSDTVPCVHVANAVTMTEMQMEIPVWTTLLTTASKPPGRRAKPKPQFHWFVQTTPLIPLSDVTDAKHSLCLQNAAKLWFYNVSAVHTSVHPHDHILLSFQLDHSFNFYPPSLRSTRLLTSFTSPKQHARSDIHVSPASTQQLDSLLPRGSKTNERLNIAFGISSSGVCWPPSRCTT
jgi:hypothetical protein